MTENYTLSDIAAVTDGNRNNGMFGNDAWWIIILLLFGYNGRGFGGFGCGNGGGYEPCATQADVRAAVDQQTLISKLDQQTYGLADSTYALNNTINQNFRGVDNAICNLGYNVQSGFNAIGHQISDCCCQTQRAIDGVNYNIATQTAAIQNTLCGSTRDIVENQNSNARAILDALTANKIEAKNERIAEQQQQIFALQLAASQAQQNQYLIGQLRPCPVPAYITCNPFAAAGYGGGGCGCGCYGAA